MFFMGWGKRQEHTAFQARVHGFLKQLKEERKVKVGVVGFCWVQFISSPRRAQVLNIYRAVGTRLLQASESTIFQETSL